VEIKVHRRCPVAVLVLLGNQSSSSLSGGGAGAAGVSVTAKKSCSAKKLSEFR